MDQYSQVMLNMSSLTLKANHEKDGFTKYSYNALLMNKGFLLAAEQSLDDIIKSNGDSLAFNLYKERERLQSSLKEIAVNPNISEERVAEINDSLLLIQRQLARKAEQYGYLDFLSIKYDSIRNAIKDNEYIVDFTDFVDENRTTQYVAYVFNKHDEFPHLMKVFMGGELDSLKADLELHKLYEGDVASNIVKLIWNPIKETIDIPEGATVYFIPSGELYRLSLESLPIEGNYKFIRLSSAREVIKRNNSLIIDKNRNPNVVLYGGLEYDLPDETMKKEHEKYVDRIPSYVLERGDDSIGNSRNQGWKELPGTEEEVRAVENVLKDSHEIRRYTGSEGTEESFLSLHGHAPQIMLMSTHGFYYTPTQAENKAYFKGYTDAMSLSGLILSGGNRAWRGESLPEGVLPGILTADKISRMNFEGLDLVVLSACQTGQGKVTPEGVYGLQRAFKKAGAGTVVMTLWNVDDKATKDFMVRFFENLVSNGWSKRKAFDEAREYIKSQEIYKEPYYWAGFVMLD
jgi:CHAT domain-containing protein